MRVLVDVDGVLADLVGALCRHIGMFGYVRTPDYVRTYDFSESFTRDEMRLVEGAMARPGFCRDLPWYPGAQDFLVDLSESTEVVAVTKPHRGSPTWGHERTEWLQPYCPKVVLTAHKEVCVGDVLVEDHPGNALRWLDHHPGKRAVLVDRPWNRSPVTMREGLDLVRVQTYGQALAAILRT